MTASSGTRIRTARPRRPPRMLADQARTRSPGVPERLAGRVRRHLHGQRERAPSSWSASPFRSRPGAVLLTADNHNSVNGIREFARAHGATVTYLPFGARPSPGRRRRSRPRSRPRGRAPLRLPGPVQLFRRPPSARLGRARRTTVAGTSCWTHPLTCRRTRSTCRGGTLTSSRSPGTRSSATRRASGRWSPGVRRSPACGARGSPAAHRRRLGRRAAAHAWRGRDRLRGRHHRLPGAARIEIGLRHMRSVGCRRSIGAWRFSRAGCSAACRRCAIPMGARRSVSTVRPTTSIAAAPPVQRARSRRATSWTSGTSRRRPPTGASHFGPAASATRAPARRPAASPRRRWRACSRWAATRVRGSAEPSARQGARRGPRLGRDRHDRARRQPVRRVPRGVRGERRSRPALSPP